MFRQGRFLLFIAFIACGASTPSPPAIDESLKPKADFVFKQYNKDGRYNPDICLLIDYSIHSGMKRFFVWQQSAKKVRASGLCCHGSCKQTLEPRPPAFSNVSGSSCSSEGVYRIGSRDYSSWGKHFKYWMVGLDKTNSNAVDRIVVLHAWDGVPNEDIYPTMLYHSDGCPTVSPKFLDTLDGIIKASKKPLLLYIYK